MLSYLQWCQKERHKGQYYLPSAKIACKNKAFSFLSLTSFSSRGFSVIGFVENERRGLVLWVADLGSNKSGAATVRKHENVTLTFFSPPCVYSEVKHMYLLVLEVPINKSQCPLNCLKILTLVITPNRKQSSNVFLHGCHNNWTPNICYCISINGVFVEMRGNMRQWEKSKF